MSRKPFDEYQVAPVMAVDWDGQPIEPFDADPNDMQLEQISSVEDMDYVAMFTVYGWREDEGLEAISDFLIGPHRSVGDAHAGALDLAYSLSMSTIPRIVDKTP